MWGRDTVLNGRYHLHDRIGVGSMGDVWRAQDIQLRRDVAVKILLPGLLDDDQFTKRFEAEARVLAHLKHPGIVTVHDRGESSDPRVAYLVMELLEGRPLSLVMAEAEVLGPAFTLSIVAQTLDALHVAHENGVVHRDVKPANLVLDDRNRITVTDFGVAWTVGGNRLTAGGVVMGTALYSAPEQMRKTAVTAAADLYSVGVIAYECLSGLPPFDGDNPLIVLARHAEDPVPELPADIPAPVRDLVMRALSKDPDDRFVDAAQMADAARAALAGLPSDGAHGSADMPPSGVRPTAGPGQPLVPTTEPSAWGAAGDGRLPAVMLSSPPAGHGRGGLRVRRPRYMTGRRLTAAAVILACAGAGAGVAVSGHHSSRLTGGKKVDPTGANTAYQVSGRLSCSSGAPVVGIWVQASVGSDWAQDKPDPNGTDTDYWYTLPKPEQYSLHVGCGRAADGQWNPLNPDGHHGVHSLLVTGPQNSFDCDDENPSAYYGSCAKRADH